MSTRQSAQSALAKSEIPTSNRMVLLVKTLPCLYYNRFFISISQHKFIFFLYLSHKHIIVASFQTSLLGLNLLKILEERVVVDDKDEVSEDHNSTILYYQLLEISQTF